MLSEWGHMEGQILLLREVFQRRVVLPSLNPRACLACMLTGLLVAAQPSLPIAALILATCHISGLLVIPLLPTGRALLGTVLCGHSLLLGDTVRTGHYCPL